MFAQEVMELNQYGQKCQAELIKQKLLKIIKEKKNDNNTR